MFQIKFVISEGTSISNFGIPSVVRKVNLFFPVCDVIAAAITSQINKAKMPTHIEIGAADYGLSKDSVILLEQVRTIDKKRLKERIGHLNENLMNRVNEAIEISLGLEEE